MRMVSRLVMKLNHLEEAGGEEGEQAGHEGEQDGGGAREEEEEGEEQQFVAPCTDGAKYYWWHLGRFSEKSLRVPPFQNKWNKSSRISLPDKILVKSKRDY